MPIKITKLDTGISLLDVSKITDEVLIWDKTREIVSRLASNRLQIELFFIKNNILGILDYLKREGTSILDEIQA